MPFNNYFYFGSCLSRAHEHSNVTSYSRQPRTLSHCCSPWRRFGFAKETRMNTIVWKTSSSVRDAGSPPSRGREWPIRGLWIQLELCKGSIAIVVQVWRILLLFFEYFALIISQFGNNIDFRKKKNNNYILYPHEVPFSSPSLRVQQLFLEISLVLPLRISAQSLGRVNASCLALGRLIVSIAISISVSPAIHISSINSLK